MCVEPADDQPQPPLFEVVANTCDAAVRPLSDEMYARVEVDAQSVVDPFEVRNCPFDPAEPVLSKSLRMVAMVVVLKVVEALVTFEVPMVSVPETMRDGDESAPFEAMVVVPVWPTAR